MTRRPVSAAIASAACVLALVVGCARSDDTARHGTMVGEPAALRLNHLSESMLIDEDAVPALAGSSWGRIVAAPQGVEPTVTPPECALFLSHGVASQKAMALRSSKSGAIGVELALADVTRDLPDLLDRCRSFSFDGGPIRSVVDVEPSAADDLPAGAIRAVLHCQRMGQGATVAWDIAMVAGYRRGIFVIALYTPGPYGPGFDAELADSLGDMYRNQIAKLDGA